MNENLIIIKNVSQVPEVEYHFNRMNIPYHWSMAGGFLVPSDLFADAVNVLLMYHIDISY